MISSKSTEKEYLNYMARAIRVVTEFPAQYKEMQALADIERITQETFDKLKAAFVNGEKGFFDSLSELVDRIEDTTFSERFMIARAIAIWLDDHMTYEPEDEVLTFSIAMIVPFTTDELVYLNSLNDNVKATGICIMPYLEATECYGVNDNDEETKRITSPHMHEVLWEMNDDLKRCRYRIANEGIIVEHIIMSWHARESVNSHFFRVAFSPLTRESELLDWTIENDVRPYGQVQKRRYNEPKNSDMLEKRLKSVIKFASESGLKCDLLFGPEMLGTNKMYQDDGSYVLKTLEENGCDPDDVPKLIILPSRTNQGRNYCYIFNNYGEKLGEQYKMFPYRSKKEHYEEALDNHGEIRYFVIHIPRHARIVIMICKDFLEDDPHLHELIYKQINPTLIIVPSYTIGETDFIESIQSGKKYGTSVVWGTCCGAPRASEAYIGAASIIRMDNISKMSDACTCGRKCDESKACIFYIDIPIKIREREKKNVEFKHLIETIEDSAS